MPPAGQVNQRAAPIQLLVWPKSSRRNFLFGQDTHQLHIPNAQGHMHRAAVHWPHFKSTNYHEHSCLYLCTHTYKIHTQTLYIYLSLLHSTAFQETTQKEGSSSISLKFCGYALKVHVLQRYYVMIESPWTASEAREIAPSGTPKQTIKKPKPQSKLWIMVSFKALQYPAVLYQKQIKFCS